MTHICIHIGAAIGTFFVILGIVVLSCSQWYGEENDSGSPVVDIFVFGVFNDVTGQFVPVGMLVAPCILFIRSLKGPEHFFLHEAAILTGGIDVVVWFLRLISECVTMQLLNASTMCTQNLGNVNCRMEALVVAGVFLTLLGEIIVLLIAVGHKEVENRLK